MRVILFFNNLKGLSTFKILKKNKIKIIKIFLSNKYLNENVKKKLNQYKEKYEIIKNINSINLIKKIEKLSSDLNIIAGFPYIFPRKLIHIPKYGTINLHSGPLPKYRGGSPLNWQIINNEKYIGLCVIKINEKIDSGFMITKDKFKLKNNHTIKDVHAIVNKKFENLVLKAIKYLKINKKFIKISKTNSNYFKQRKPQDGQIIWDKMNNLQVFNLVRAVTKPYPGAFSYYNKKKVLIFKVKTSSKKISGMPGKIEFLNNKKYVKCYKSSIQLIKIHPKIVKKGFFYYKV